MRIKSTGRPQSKIKLHILNYSSERFIVYCTSFSKVQTCFLALLDSLNIFSKQTYNSKSTKWIKFSSHLVCVWTVYSIDLYLICCIIRERLFEIPWNSAPRGHTVRINLCYHRI